MSVSRRNLLKGMAAGTFAGWVTGNASGAPAGSAAPSLAAEACAPLLVLLNEGAPGSMFLAGASSARSSGLQAANVGRDLACMLGFERRLRSGRPLRVIGLLDDASATLAVDVARGAGARMQWLGQHTVGAGFGRHRLLDTEAAPRRPRARAFDTEHSAAWAYEIGYLLAAPDGSLAAPASAPTGSIAPHGSFVSFSIEARRSRSDA